MALERASGSSQKHHARAGVVMVTRRNGRVRGRVVVEHESADMHTPETLGETRNEVGRV